MIDSIHLRNFKAHKDTRIPLQRLTALVGPNSSGKTSVLQGLDVLCDYVYENESFSPRVMSKIMDAVIRKDEKSFEASLYFTHGEKWHYRLLGNFVLVDGHKRWNEPTILVNRNRRIVVPTANNKHLDKKDFYVKTLHQKVPRSVYLKLNSANLSEPSRPSDAVPKVGKDGSGLASTIAFLKTYHDEVFDNLKEAIRSVIPQVKRIRIRKKEVQQTKIRHFTMDGGNRIPFSDSDTFWGDELVFDMVGAKEVPAHAMSEGTLLVVGLLTVLMSPECPRLVLMDDIEQGLHPKAQREFIEVLRKLQEEKKDLQIVMTTHSPYIVDELSEEEVIVMATDGEGIVHAQCLTDHPDAEKALEVLTTGEFLSAEGEDWVLNVEKTS